MANWSTLADTFDFPAALAACPQTSTWELAEIEERWGDSLFFAGQPGAAEHYHAARAALIPPGSQFSSAEENDRRMQAHQRVTNKLYAIGPDGLARAGQDGEPHPRSRPAPPPKPSKTERLAAVVQLRQATQRQQTGLGRLFPGDHWRHHDLGDKWCAAGQALAEKYPDAARRAYDWSTYYFELYNKEWTAHLPASRWDSDGSAEMMEVNDLLAALVANPSQPLLPAWVDALLAGDWQAAQTALGDTSPPEFRLLFELLDEARQAAGLH